MASGSDEYVALAAVLAFMAAAFLLQARIIRLGFMADFLSRTVLVGFLTGVGLQVALGQLSAMLGLQDRGHGTLHLGLTQDGVITGQIALVCFAANFTFARRVSIQ